MVFDPQKHVISLGNDANGKDQKYLEVKYRKAWFRNEHPTGRIISSIHTINPNMAIAKAEIYFEKDDTIPVAVDFGSAYYSSTEIGIRFVENAVTNAIGRALASAGYNILEASEEEEKPCDAPMLTESQPIELNIAQTLPDSVAPLNDEPNPAPLFDAIMNQAAEAISEPTPAPATITASPVMPLEMPKNDFLAPNDAGYKELAEENPFEAFSNNSNILQDFIQ